MHSIRLEWKEFNVSLENLEAHMRSEYSQYLGNQAASCLELFFSEEPSQEDKEAIEAHWDSLDGSDYKSAQVLADEIAELEAAKIAMKAGLVSKSWDQMSTVERKVAMNMEVSREEMGL